MRANMRPTTGSRRWKTPYLLLMILMFTLSTFTFYIYYAHNEADLNFGGHVPKKRIISRDINQIEFVHRFHQQGAPDLGKGLGLNHREEELLFRDFDSDFPIQNVQVDAVASAAAAVAQEEVFSWRKTRIREMTVEESLANIAAVESQISQDFTIARSGLPHPDWHNYVSDSVKTARRRSVKEYLPKSTSPIPKRYVDQPPRYRLNDKYILNNPSLCNVKDLYMVIVVMSEINSYYVRKVIRETWGRLSTVYGHEVRLVFMVGAENQANEYYSNQYLIVKEHFKYKDVVQRDFVDNYFNLTRKSVAALQWASEFCSNARFMLRLVENVLFNPYKVFKLLDSGRLKRRGLMLGNVRRSLVTVADDGGRVPQWPVLINGRKYAPAVDRYYPLAGIPWKRKYYPPYLSRPYVLMSNDTVLKLSVMAERTPLMFPDYVYASILAVKSGVVQQGRREWFIDYKDGRNVYAELTSTANRSKAIFGHIPSGFNAASKISQFWDEVQQTTEDKRDCLYWFDRGQNIRETFPRDLPYNENDMM